MPTREAVAAWLEEHVAEALGLTPADINPAASFESLGLPSRDAIVVSGDLAEWLGRSLPPTLLYEFPSIDALAAHLSALDAIAPAPDAERFGAAPQTAPFSDMFWHLVFDGDPPVGADRERLRETLEAAMAAGATPAPLSSGQKRLWFLDQLEEDRAVYNLASLAMSIKGPLNVSALERSIHFITERHGPLRTRYATIGGRPIQLLDPKSTARLEVWDFRRAEREGIRAEFPDRARRFVTRPFDLKRGPLIRPLLARFADDDHLFLAPVHHVAMDGVSMSVFMGELRTAYEAYCQDVEPELGPLPATYSDFAYWQRSHLHTPEFEPHLAFWRDKLEGAPPLYSLTAERPRPATQIFDGAAHTIWLPRETTSALAALARTRTATLNAVLLAIFNALLARYTGGTDVVVGTPMAARHGAAMEKLIGFFVNSVVLRTDLSGNPTIVDAIARTSEALREAAAHQDAPFDAVVEAVAPDRDMGHPPLFQIQFVHEPAPEAADRLGECSVEEWPIHTGKAKYELTLFVRETGDGLRLTFEYATALFEQTTIERFARYYVRMIDAALADGARGIDDIDLMDEIERRAMEDWNKTDDPRPFTSIVDQIYARAEETPDALAVVCEDDSDGSPAAAGLPHTVTYAELIARAEAIANAISLEPVDFDSRVAICAERSVDCVVGILGILRAGAAFVPIDPEMPDARIAELIADSGAATVLVTKSTRDRVEALCARVIVIEDVAAGSPTASAPINPSNAAYVIYTSGSTGKPKGVVVEHGNLANYVAGVTDRLALRPGHSFAMVTTFAADLGYTALFPTLCAGGVLHVVTKERAMSASALGEYVARHEIDYMKIVPSHLRALLGASHGDPSGLAQEHHKCHPCESRDLGSPSRARLHAKSLVKTASSFAARGGEDVLPRRCIVLGGEALTWDLAALIHAARPDLRVINHYGPTETTVGCLTHEIDWAAPRIGATVPVGRPLANVRAYIVDSKLRPVPPGLPGELCIAGAGVARGYLGNRGQSPIFEGSSGEGNRWLSPISEGVYGTGDRARQGPGGEIEFLGRADRQAKVRGYRVELGEIESALRALEGVADCAVVLDGSGGDVRLHAYAVASGNTLSPAEIRARLRESLPEYMVPASVVLLDALPITANGKLDTRALPAPSPETSDGATALTTPTEFALADLWGQLLKTAVSGAEDNFLDLGGHSLLAIEMLTRLNQEFRVELALRDAFEAPTVRGLARRIDDAKRGRAAAARNADGAARLLVAIQPGDGRPALFCIAPAGGTTFPYYALAHHLGTEQGVYCLQDPASDGTRRPLKRVEDMAREYIAAMRALQPEGPYHVAGWSFGGVVAYEMARLLGEHAGIVALIEAFAPESRRAFRIADVPANLRFAVRVAGSGIQTTRDSLFLMTNPRNGNGGLRRVWSNALYRLYLDRAQMAGVVAENEELLGIDQPSTRRFLTIARANLKAGKSYAPGPYAGDVHVFKASDQPRTTAMSNALGWERLVPDGRVRVHTIQGDHFCILRNPHVAKLAAVISRSLREYGHDDAFASASGCPSRSISDKNSLAPDIE